MLALGALDGLAGGEAMRVAAAQRQVTLPPPNCTPNARLTPSQTEGPFYKTGSPQRTSLLEPGLTGTRLIVTGYVLSPGYSNDDFHNDSSLASEYDSLAPVREHGATYPWLFHSRQEVRVRLTEDLKNPFQGRSKC